MLREGVASDSVSEKATVKPTTFYIRVRLASTWSSDI
jgi:hypothetical protein